MVLCVRLKKDKSLINAVKTENKNKMETSYVMLENKVVL